MHYGWEVLDDALPGGVEGFGGVGGGEGFEGGLGEAGAEVALLGLLGLELVDERHELVDSGDDALLVGQGGEQQWQPTQSSLVDCALAGCRYRVRDDVCTSGSASS